MHGVDARSGIHPTAMHGYGGDSTWRTDHDRHRSHPVDDPPRPPGRPALRRHHRAGHRGRRAGPRSDPRAWRREPDRGEPRGGGAAVPAQHPGRRADGAQRRRARRAAVHPAATAEPAPGAGGDGLPARPGGDPRAQPVEPAGRRHPRERPGRERRADRAPPRVARGGLRPRALLLRRQLRAPGRDLPPRPPRPELAGRDALGGRRRLPRRQRDPRRRPGPPGALRSGLPGPGRGGGRLLRVAPRGGPSARGERARARAAGSAPSAA